MDMEKNTKLRVSVCGEGGVKTMGGRGVPDEKDFEGGDVLRWDGISVFPNASKLAKLVCLNYPEVLQPHTRKNYQQAMDVEIKTMAGQCMG